MAELFAVLSKNFYANHFQSFGMCSYYPAIIPSLSNYSAVRRRNPHWKLKNWSTWIQIWELSDSWRKNDIRWWARMGESEDDHWSLTVSLWRLNCEIELCGAIHPRRIFSLTTRGYSMENIKHISRSTSYCRLAMLLTLLMADLYAMDRLLSCQLAAYKCVTDPVADHRRNTHTAWLRSQIWVN